MSLIYSYNKSISYSIKGWWLEDRVESLAFSILPRQEVVYEPHAIVFNVRFYSLSDMNASAKEYLPPVIPSWSSIIFL